MTEENRIFPEMFSLTRQQIESFPSAQPVGKFVIFLLLPHELLIDLGLAPPSWIESFIRVNKK